MPIVTSDQQDSMISRHREPLSSWCRNVVIKIGSAVLSDGKEFDHRCFENLVRGVSSLRESGIEVTVVCSGAVALGMTKLSLQQRPTSIGHLQAIASVGQVELASRWDRALNAYNLASAQVLLTHDDVKDRKRFLAARQTFRELLALGVVPIINENDAIAVEEIKMGDNDLLSSLVVSLTGAQHLIILSNIQGLLSFETHSQGTRISMVDRIDDQIMSLVNCTKSSVGSGGMQTKLEAVRRVNELGVNARIACGKNPGVLEDCLNGRDIGTWFCAQASRLNSRKHWIAYALETKGVLVLDEGACDAIVNRGKSLLPIGVVSVEGNYEEGELVELRSIDGQPIARGLVGTDASTTALMRGKRLEDIERLLGWSTVLVHRDDLVLSTAP